ncbi:MAG: hypothetical protein ACK55I_08620, partial [bacterium]
PLGVSSRRRTPVLVRSRWLGSFGPQGFLHMELDDRRVHTGHRLPLAGFDDSVQRPRQRRVQRRQSGRLHHRLERGPNSLIALLSVALVATSLIAPHSLTQEAQNVARN